jgi:hypothetical protein
MRSSVGLVSIAAKFATAPLSVVHHLHTIKTLMDAATEARDMAHSCLGGLTVDPPAAADCRLDGEHVDEARPGCPSRSWPWLASDPFSTP